MSSAVLQAVELGAVLDRGANDERLVRGARQARGKVIDNPWKLAVGADFAYPECTGPKPPGTDLVNRYLARALVAAEVSPEVNTQLILVQNLHRSAELVAATDVRAEGVPCRVRGAAPSRRRAADASSRAAPRQRSDRDPPPTRARPAALRSCACGHGSSSERSSIVVGIVWIFQGVGTLHGSFMTDAAGVGRHRCGRGVVRCRVARGRPAHPSLALDRGEVVVHRAHRARSLADRGRDPLERAVAHVADREHAGHRRLERQRVAASRTSGPTHVVGQRSIGEDETAGVERHHAVEPLGRGIGADEAEEPGAGERCGARPSACARA